MRAGKLRHRVAIQTRSASTDSYGGQVETWTDLAVNVPASIEPLKGRDLIAAQAVQSEITHRVTVRYLDSLSGAMRIVFNDRIFSIVGPPQNRDERNRELQFLCSEGLNQG